MDSTKPAPINIKPIVWKERIKPSYADHDEEMQRVVAIIKGGHESRLLRWIEICDSINKKDSGGNTVLHWASSLGSLTAVTRLLLAGADVKAENQIGATPLHCAAVGGHAAVIEQLLRNGADAMAKNGDGQTMFDLFRSLGWKDLSILYNHLENALHIRSFDYQERESINFTREAFLGALVSPVVRDGSPLTESCASFAYYTVSSDDRVYVDELDECLWGLALEVLSADEVADRQAVVNEYLEWALQVVFDPSLAPPPPPPPAAAAVVSPPARIPTANMNNNSSSNPSVTVVPVTQPVEAVLGERHAGDSRQLLVRLRDGAIVWAAEEDVANEAAVRDYADRLDHTNVSFASSPTNTYSNSNANGNVFLCGDPFEYSERVELARQLEQLPHGRLPSPTATQHIAKMQENTTPAGVLPPLRVSQQSKGNVNRGIYEPYLPALETDHHMRLQHEQEQEAKWLLESNPMNVGLPKIGCGGNLSNENMTNTLAYYSSSDGVDTTHNSSYDRVDTGKKRNNNSINSGNHSYGEKNVTEGIHTTEKRGGGIRGKLPPIRQVLSEDEKIAYEKFLRQSALKYLRRKTQEMGLQL
ncbi:LmrCD-specific DARPin [Trypanosoma theileri]|uniref:LmrCD-specific DARPin n=1 Tax=Trypanosoma theileri TaxID=67003 RepID=A0A1X0NV56_9TRYP|nr:LmrCD-specific DARPin [Trypanosoma theileri]ORC88373.1 LmrCD-specific DARPin [Trypanosoma theileri]